MNGDGIQNNAQLTVEIITIGREILDGRVIDSNSSYLGEKLNELGLCPRFAQRVDDELDRICEAFRVAAQRSKIIICTGGLGPTSDDLTAEAFARYVNEKLVLNTDALQMVKDAFERINRPFTEVQKKQALLATSAVPMFNAVGTAPGFKKVTATHSWYFVPGVPREMKAIFENCILPELALPTGTPLKYTWKTQFTSEGELQARIDQHCGPVPEHFEICYRTRLPENHISLIGVSQNSEQSLAFENYQKKLSACLNTDCYYSGSLPNPPELEEILVSRAIEKKVVLAAVESCTGGLVTHRLSNVPRSSKALFGSFVTYDNRAKIDLGVSLESIKKWGAVSEACASEMALFGLKKTMSLGSGPALCVSTSGIAGPGGGSAEKPVGLCHLAVAGLDSQGKQCVLAVEKVNARAGLLREDYKKIFSQKALWLLLSQLN